MLSAPSGGRSFLARLTAGALPLFAAAALATTAASAQQPGTPRRGQRPEAPPRVVEGTRATLDDPRVGLAPGEKNGAGVSAQAMRLVSYSPKPPVLDFAQGLSYISSDLAFAGNVVYQGNFSGITVWDVADPARPKTLAAIACATDQGDPSIYGDLLFISAESNRVRKDCGMDGVEDGADRMRGVRIFDVSNPAAPQLVQNVQTCRGSHTHTVVPDPRDSTVIYLYVGGSSGVRDSLELAGCSSGSIAENPRTAQYRVDIIRVPLRNPAAAAVVGHARIFEGLQPVGARGGPSGCHDLTSYPAHNLVAGACGSYGILLDASDPEHPVRLDAISDENFSLWHTAVFSNDGSKVVFTDEWGGGTAPRCRATDPIAMGGNTILSIGADRKLTRHAYFKMPAAQENTENCVSHNGGLIPVPGRDIMVQGWYQGGVDVFDFTDPDHPVEIAWFDRGPVDGEELVVGGSWGAYWHNGYVYSSELSRGLDVLELLPSEFLSANEIAAAKLVTYADYNPQSQPKLVWPAAFPVVRSYLDQLVRNGGLAPARTTALDQALTAAEAASGASRARQLNQIAAQLDADARTATDAARVRAMAQAARDLAAATR